ncbi:MAG: hypothetical protein ACI376_06975 [Candidatus Bruticola sp.]
MHHYWLNKLFQAKNIIKVVNELAKCKIFIFVLFLLCGAVFFSLLSCPVSAAVVEGDDIIRYVDTPTGTVLHRGTAIDTSPQVPVSDNGYKVPEQQVESTLPTRPAPKVTDKEEMPEVPNFTAEVEAPVAKKKDSNLMFIVIGAIVVIIGLGVILFIAKSREKE